VREMVLFRTSILTAIVRICNSKKGRWSLRSMGGRKGPVQAKRSGEQEMRQQQTSAGCAP
jgi:hypothetical protein